MESLLLRCAVVHVGRVILLHEFSTPPPSASNTIISKHSSKSNNSKTIRIKMSINQMSQLVSTFSHPWLLTFSCLFSDLLADTSPLFSLTFSPLSLLQSSLEMEKETQFSLSSERLEFLLQQGLQASNDYLNPTTATMDSPPHSIQGSFSSASPASSRDYFNTPEQSVEDEVFDFAFDQPLFPTGPSQQGGAGMVNNQLTQSNDAQDWFPLFNDDGNGLQSNSIVQSNGAPRVLDQTQFTTVAPASVEELDLGMTIKHFLDGSPISTPSPTNSVNSNQSLVNNNGNQEENLDDLAKNFLRKFANARKSEDVSFLVNAFRGAGIEIPSEVLDHQQKNMDIGGSGKMNDPFASHDHHHHHGGDSCYSNQIPSFGFNYESHSSSSNSSYSSSSNGGSPISNWNFNDYSLINQSSDSIISNNNPSSSEQDPSKVRSSLHSTSNKGGVVVKKPRSGGKRRSGEGNPKCPECGKEFSRMFNMKTHLETHLSPDERPKPFVCDVDTDKCTRGFSRRSDLKRHIRTVHPDIKVNNDKKDLETKDNDLSSI